MLEKLPSLVSFQPKFHRGGRIAVHLPLLYDIVSNTKPRVAVTLGFGNGEAFFTMCQAAREQARMCRCVATRRGTGRESDDVDWQNGKMHAAEFYADIATLPNESSLACAESFADKSVDLLLIDDCDSGDVITRELEAWTPKLSDNATILLHGARLERRDSPRAAWQKWIGSRSAAELPDGIGLAIARQQSIGDFFLELFGLDADEVRQLHAIALHRCDVQNAKHHRAALEVQRAWLHSVVAKDADVRTLIRNLAANTNDLKSKFEPLQRDRAKAQLILDAQMEQLQGWAAQLETLRNERDALSEKVKKQKAIINAAKNACRKNGNCFRVSLTPEPKPRRPVTERIAREINRWPRKLRQLVSPAAPVEIPKTNGTSDKPNEPATDRYATWIAEHEPDEAQLDEQRRLAAEWSGAPKISLLLPVLDTPAKFLDAMLESVVAQTYANWELCVVDAASTKQETIDVLQKWSAADSRIQIQRLDANRGIAANTNAAFAMATGSWITCIDHDDIVAPFASFEVACAIRAAPDAEIIYSDEDRLTENGRRHSPFFKPDWSPALLISSMYLGHLTIYRRELIDSLGGWRSEFDLSQDYDLALRATDQPRVVAHIPYVLYHWREHAASGSAGGKPDARKTNLAALADAMRRRNFPAEVLEYPTANRARLKSPRAPKVSIIIPTDSPVRSRRCIERLLSVTAYPEFEIIIVTNSSLAEVLNAAKPAGAAVHCVPFDAPFNFSAKCNVGAAAATGERLIFYNDDVDPEEREWIQNLIEPLEDPSVGAVAPKLLYETGKIQHAGLVTGVRGLIGTAFHQWPADSTDYVNLAQSLRDVSALSGACLAMRRKDFFRLGEWDAINTPIAHSDLDLCFKVRAAGMRCVYTPFTTLTHRGHESIGGHLPNEQSSTPREKPSVFLLKRWGGYTCEDPYFPRNMRDWLYADSPTPIRMWGRNENALRETRADLLFVSHDLTWSGAPLILFQIAKWLRARGFFITIMSAEDGPLRDEIRASGIPLIVDPLLAKGHPASLQFAREFDCIVASTIFSAPVVNAAKAAGIPHLWWIHEGRIAEDYFDKFPAIRAALSLADLIVIGDTRSAQIYQPFRDGPIRVLPIGIDDPAVRFAAAKMRTDRPLTFLLLGSVEHRKGHDVFLQALRALPADVLQRARFEIVGRPHDPALTKKVRDAAAEIPNLNYRGGVSPDDALRVMHDADVVVCASWDETGPLVLIESLALAKPILSTRVGAVAEYTSADDVGIFVDPGDAQALANAIAEMVRNPERLAQMSTNARAAYERYFTFERFADGFEKIVEQVLASTAPVPA